MVQHRLEERLLSIKEDASIASVFCDAVDWIFGPLVTEGSARTVFQAAMRREMIGAESRVEPIERHSNFDMENPAAAAMLEMTKRDDLHVASSEIILKERATYSKIAMKLGQVGKMLHGVLTRGGALIQIEKYKEVS